MTPTDDASNETANPEPTFRDLVYASAHGLMEPDYPWAVGIIVGWAKDATGRKHYLIAPKWGATPYFKFGLPHVQKVTKSSAKRIIRALRRARRRPLRDQIWECLIQIHKHQAS